jgi:NCAIR mutase (PurE)-related protein
MMYLYDVQKQNIPTNNIKQGNIMNFNLIKLKIKSKHLAKEPAIIKHEEAKLKAGFQRDSLRDHRVLDVRNEARATQLAIAFIRGKAYNSIEQHVKELAHPKHQRVGKRVTSMVTKYHSNKVTRAAISAWSGGVL